MPSAVSLSEVIAALQFSEATAVSYFDRTASRIVTSPPEEVETGGPAEAKAGRIPEDWVPLPLFNEEHEIELAHQFATTVERADDRERLCMALAGVDPFEAFATAIFRCEIANEWYQYRDHHLLQLARSWLESQAIPYIDDVSRETD